MIKKIKEIYQFSKQVIVEFSSGDALKYSASLSYYTIFSLAPMLIILIAICSFLFSKQAINGEIYGQIKNFVGNDAASQIQNTLKNIHLSKDTRIATIIGVATLIISTTGIFGEIQDSLNKIWGLRIKTKRILWKLILNRILSFSLVLSFGFVLVASLILNAIILSLGNQLNHFFLGMLSTFMPLIETVFSFIITTILFAAIFKFLPDAKIKWKDVRAGALVTSLLFMLGKFIIGYYLSTSRFTAIYGAAGSVIVILLWTYYSSAILYMGAEFTKVYAIRYGHRIAPNDYSVWIKTEEVPMQNVTSSK